ncbi:MAG: cell surface protein SprA [Bacteroidota bacterium]
MGSPKNVALFVVLGFVLPILAITVPNANRTWFAAGEYIDADSTKRKGGPGDSTAGDSSKLKYPIKDKKNFEDKEPNGLDLEDPSNIKKEVVYDSSTGQYVEKQTVGGDDYRLPETKDLGQYLEERRKKENQDYFRQRSKAQNYVQSNGNIFDKLKTGPKIIDRLFGSGLVDLRPQGSAEIIFGWNFNVVRNPAFTVRQQRNGQFDFRQKIQFNLTGTIGDRFKTNWRYDTEATFDFDNQINLNWEGKEDDIIKNVQLGNVSLPLNSSLIQGGQSLFGAKLQMQFGRLMVTTIFTQQRGQTTETEVTGGAQVTNFDIQADNYDVNRHYFLSQYFANNYDQWCSTPAFINSPVLITNVEVWVTNRTGVFENTRDILGFMDLGEATPYNNQWLNPTAPINPDNTSNTLYNTMQLPANALARESNDAVNHLRQTMGLNPIQDFQLLNNARQLGTNEFTFNPRLGYISLNQQLNNDEILAVAFEYTMNGQVYRVGEFARQIQSPDPNQPKVLMLKMLKGSTITTNLPIWDLMMKNIYSLGAFSVKKEQFKLNVIYADDPTGADLNYIPVLPDEPNFATATPLISILNCDRVNQQNEPTPDGIFDFLDGITINVATGRIIFPVREPFGRYLRTKFTQQKNADYYAFDALYDSTKWLAQQEVLKNKFFLRGSYQGSSNSEISLNAINVPKGSVRVTANGTLLTEGTDYIVDYTVGRVKILNTGILNSGAVIKVTSENNNLFSIQQKTLMGARFDYKIDKDFIVGGTVMHLYERPITPKVNIGEEPLLNTIVGIDGTIRRESRGLTRLIDRLPFISTKEPSNIQFSFEGAKLFPHDPKTIGQRGTAFIDDFEASETPFDLRLGTGWFIASTPEGQPDLFPETQSPTNALQFGQNRARLAWYSLDNIFLSELTTSSPPTPSNLRDATILSNHYTRQVNQTEVFPNRQLQQGVPTNLPTFDLAYYPYKPGPYNFSVSNLNAQGELANPRNSWGGIMRRIDQNDFEAANIDYVEIWMMDPFLTGPNGTIQDGKFNSNNLSGGSLYLNLGSVSEDVLRDTRKSFENGLPKPNTPLPLIDTTEWAIVPNVPAINNAFDADPDVRDAQDVGLDGMSDATERVIFALYLDSMRNAHGATSAAYLNALEDPARDNYKFHSSGAFDAQSLGILQRHQQINGQEGNSKPATFRPDGYPITRTNQPDDEDINRDFSLNITEEYYQYKIDLKPGSLVVGRNYVTDSASVPVTLANGQVEQVTWYQLRIPINSYSRKVGNISDFKSIRFARLFLKDFDQPVVLRFAQMQLVRADWRRYTKPLSVGVPTPPGSPGDNTTFSVSTVNIEENGTRVPVNYVLPPGFFRELDVTTPNNVQQNEQSLSVRFCNLKDGDARGVFKTTRFDIRNYKRLRMFVHAEGEDNNLRNGDVKAFIRLGTDLENNYYEYELPLLVTPNNSRDAQQVWPSENEINIALEEFYLAKQLRENAKAPLTQDFVYDMGGGKRITLKGLPDMSNVRVIMMGVRNPLKNDNPGADDGLEKCGEIWFNELRVVEFNNQGGEAATARMVTKLADLGTFTISGNYQSIGWGGIDKKLNDRSLNEIFLYDMQTSLELGKFFPAKWGITVPFFMQRGEQFIRPKYNPLNPDILLSTTLRTAQTEEQKQEILNAAEDYTARRSYNFTNVRKNRTGGGNAKLWDIENLNGSFSFQEVFRRNQQIAASLQRTWRGSVGYTFATGAKSIEPFKKIKGGKYMQLIRDFNFTLYPQSFSARADVDRYYARLINRNNDGPLTIVPILYDKNFTMNRVYDMRWDLTKSLKIDYQSTANARIDEPAGRIDQNEDPSKVDTIQNNLIGLGRTTNFTQVTNVNYTLPLAKLPLTDWITASTRYSANYGWTTAPPATSFLGNTIQNSQNYSYTAQFNMMNLYNKFPALRRINQNQPKQSKAEQKTDTEEEEGEGEDKKKKKKKKKEESPLSGFGTALAKTLMMLKNASVNYTSTKGTTLPGFRHTPLYAGNDAERNAPGWDFVFGSQDPEVRYRMAREGFLSIDTQQNQYFIQTSKQEFSANATLEPIKDFRVELRFIRSHTQNLQSVFRYDEASDGFRDYGFQEQGSFQVGISTLRTALEKKFINTSSPSFDQMLNNRFIIAQRLATENPRSTSTSQTGFPQGYTNKNQDVLISSFLAAYTGKNASDQNLDLFPKIPFPSIRINYNGLSRLKAVKKFASSITLSSSYSSTYSVPQYTTLLSRTDSINPLDSNFYPKYEIRSVTINESFNPLIRIDINFINNITANFEYKSSRTLALSLSNYSLSETRNVEFVIGLGYRAKEIYLPFKIGGRKPFLKNDLNIRIDFSIRDVATMRRDLQNLVTTPTQGQRILAIKPQIDYMLNEKLNLRFYYDRRVTTPATSNAFPTAITQGGISLRYTLQ